MRSTEPPLAAPETVRAFAEEVADRAEVEISEEAHGWWIRARPRAAGAVGFTLGVSDRGEYDLFTDNGYSQEAWPWPEGVDPAALCRAVAAGRVRAEIESWRGRELWRLVVIDCGAEDWSDLRVGLLDLVVPKSWRARRVETAAPW